MRRFYIFLAIIGACFQCIQKGYFMPSENQQVQIVDGDTIRTFQVHKAKKEIKIPKQTRIYWFKNNHLFSTVGGYNGPLLEGDYSAMVSNRYLFEKGKFEFGLKEGEWLRWHPNGEIHSKYFWENGKREGPFYRYDSDGILKQTGKYKDDKINGKVIMYDINGEKIKIRYKHGEKIDTVTSGNNNEPNLEK